jgi:Uma2 family endonuclease
MSNARKYSPHYTVADYQHWKGDWELWEGIAIAMSPSPFGRHQLALTELASLIRNAIQESNCDARAVVELDWIVSDDTVVRPDVMVVCGDPPQRHLELPPAVAVEVLSDSTRKNDLGYKRNLYQDQGVTAYMIIDLEGQAITLDRRQADGSYRTETAVGSIELEICDDCTIQFSLETLFR